MAANVIPFRARPANDDSDRTPPSGPAQIVTIETRRATDPARAFEEAYHAAMIAKAERELIETRWLAQYQLLPFDQRSMMWDEREAAFQRVLQTTDDIARAPAVNKDQLARKKRVIGKVWLRAEGSMYDRFRKCVALDEARIIRKSA
jgi:hypothetical protein